jgi:hypothetical protein
LFSRVDYLAKDRIPGAGDNAGIIEFSRPSFGLLASSGSNPADCIAASFDRRAGTSTSGFAWAARREILDPHGFYDATILGGGDTAMAAAVTDCGDTVVKYHYMNKRQRERYRTWAKPFSKSTRGEIGFLDGTIFYLWHGNIQNRRPARVTKAFSSFNSTHMPTLLLMRTDLGAGIPRSQKCKNISGNIFSHGRRTVSRSKRAPRASSLLGTVWTR